MYCECEKPAAAPGTCKKMNVGNFGDWRSGNQYQNNARNLGTIPRATAAQTLTFKYKYVLGYCPRKGKGNGPTLTVKVAGKTVWTKTIDVRTADYPYDRGCGGAPNKYSPTQTASFTAPAAGGPRPRSARTKTKTARALARFDTATTTTRAKDKCGHSGNHPPVRSAAPTECSEIPLLAPSSTASARQGELEVASAALPTWSTSCSPA